MAYLNHLKLIVGPFKLIDEKYTGGMVIPPGISISWILIQAGNVQMYEKFSEW
jgi:hypothetical protein